MSINFFVKKNANSTGSTSDTEPAEIFYAFVDEFWQKEEKYHYLDSKEHCQNIDWQQITPDRRHTWLTEGLHAEFDTFIPIGSRASKRSKTAAVNVIFHTFGIGFQTSRDAWLYNFQKDALIQNVKRTSDFYNTHVLKWKGMPPSSKDVDSFVEYDDTKLSGVRD